MQWIDKIAKYTDTETVREHSKQTHKHKKFNKEFTQSSWAMSPDLAFSGGLSIVSSKANFFNNELKLSIT